MTTALSALAAMLAYTLVELRHASVAKRVLKHRVDEISHALSWAERTVKEYRFVVEKIALDEYDRVRSSSASPYDIELDRELVSAAAHGLLRRGDVLDAFALLEAADAVGEQEEDLLQNLRTELRRRGYLRRAQAVSRAIFDYTGHESDLNELSRLNAEVALLAGKFRPALPPPRMPYRPVERRILHIVGSSFPQTQSGYTLRTQYLASAQHEAGYEVHVVTQAGYAADLHGPEDIDGVTYHRLDGPVRGRVRVDHWLTNNVYELARLVQSLRPQFLHSASDFLNALSARAVGHAFGIPVVYETRGFWEETWLQRMSVEYGWHDLAELERRHGLPDSYTLRRSLEDDLRREVDHVVTLSPVMAERIGRGGVEAARISVVPNGVDVGRFPVLSRDDEFAASLGFDSETLIVGYISSIVPYEGIDDLLDAFVDLKQRTDRKIALVVVGAGSELDNLRRRARSLNVDSILFTGAVPHDEILNYYSIIDIFVAPRKPVEVCELVTPLKPFEAFSTGRAVVLSDVKALSEIAVESGAAELFEAGNAVSLADVLERLVGDPQRRRQLGTAGSEWVRRCRTWDVVARTYNATYMQVASAYGRGNAMQGTGEAGREPLDSSRVVDVDAAGTAPALTHERSVAEAIDQMSALTEDGELDRAVWLGVHLLGKSSHMPGVLERLPGLFSKVGAVSLQSQTLQMQGFADRSPALRMQQSLVRGKLYETSASWSPMRSGTQESIGGAISDRVLHIVKACAPYRQSGDTLRSRYIMDSQREAGLEPVVLTYLNFPWSLGFEDVSETETLDGSRYIHIRSTENHGPARPFDELLEDFAERAVPFVRELRPAIIHVHSGYRGYDTALVALALGQRFGIPVVYEVRGFLEATWTSEVARAEYGELYERRRDTDIRCMASADAVVTLSESMKADVVSRGVTESDVHVIPNGVDIDVFKPRRRSPALVAEYDLANFFTFGYVSNLDHYREGQEILIDAATVLRRRGMRAKALIVGDGRRRSWLEEYSKARGGEDVVVFTGQVPHENVLDFYALLDAFVIPRVPERAARLVTPLKPFEAMAVGVPLVASDLPVLREVTGDGERGRLFAAGDPEALADVIIELANDPESTKKTAERAREWVTAERQWSANGRRYAALYSTLRSG